MNARSLITAVTVSVAAAMVAAPAASAEPVVRQATGADAAAIQAAVDQFRADLGGGSTPGMNGSFGGVRREINWDGVPDAFALPDAAFPGGFFNSNSPRGVALATPGVAFAVSADDDNPADPDADEVRFSNFRDSYATAFSAFSEQRLFAPFGSPVTDTLFFVAGTDTQATTNGFGVVFTDVDAAGSAKLELIGPNGEDLGEFVAGATPGDGSLSFVGVSFDDGERIARARITSGAAALQTEGNEEDVTQGGPADLVVMDDFIYGEPEALRGQDADEKAPEVKLEGVKRKLELRALLKGVKAEVTTDEAATLDISLLATARQVQLAKPNLILAQESRGLSSATRKVRLKPKRSLLRDADRFKAEVRVIATDGSGNREVVKKKIRVRR